MIDQGLNNKQRLTIAASGIFAISRSSTDFPSTSRTFMQAWHVLQTEPTNRYSRSIATWILIIIGLIMCTHCVNTSSSAMTERPRELDQRFQMGGGSIWGYYRLRSYFSRHCDMTQFTLTHYNYGKQTISSTRPSCWRRWCTNNIVSVCSGYNLFHSG